VGEEFTNMPGSLLAIANVIYSWEVQVRKAADVWGQNLDNQTQVLNDVGERWDKLHSKIDHMQERLDQIAQEMQDRTTQVVPEECQPTRPRSETTGTLSRLSHGFEVTVESVVSSMTDATCEAVQEVKDALAAQMHQCTDTIQKHMTGLITGSDVPKKGASSLVGKIASIEKHLASMTSFQENEQYWKETSNGWRDSCDQMKERANKTQATSDKARKEAERLEQKAKGLQEQLEENQKDLQKALVAPGRDVLMSLHEIESGGNIRINRQSGRIDFVRGFEFIPPKSADFPTAEFKDADAAEACAADVAKTVCLFGSPVQLELTVMPGKGGTPAFWNDVATCQGNLFAEVLKKSKLPQSLLTVNGQVAAKGAKSGSAFAQLHKDLFPQLASSKTEGAKK